MILSNKKIDILEKICESQQTLGKINIFFKENLTIEHQKPKDRVLKKISDLQCELDKMYELFWERKDL